MPEAVVSIPARQDLLDIWEFIACDNIEAADRVRDAAFRAFERLASMPQLGTRRKLSNPGLKGVRLWPIPGFHQFLIFYRPLEQRGVEIVRVLRGSRDIGAILGEPS